MTEQTSAPTPLRQALRSTAVMAVFGLAYRYIGGAIDEGLRTWAIVGVSPLAGIFTYLESSGRRRLFAKAVIGLGVAGLLFWTWALRWGSLKAPEPSEYGYVALIFLFPLVAVALGWRMLRRERA